MSSASSQSHPEWLHGTQPPCDALLRMVRPPKWQRVFTVPNFDSFRNFIRYYATDAEVTLLTQLPVVYHHCKWNVMATRIPVGVMVGERWVPLPEVECIAEDCPRCQEGRGGYAFYWLDPRWTPEAAIDLTQTAQELKDEASMPWPRGILREPHPVRAPIRSLTNERDMPTDVFER